jgi:alpha(1,3/1,4) fucosyltransferase
MPKPTLKLGFSDFWPAFIPTDNYFYRTLSHRYDIQLSDRPDVLLYSCHGGQHHGFDGVKVFFTAENLEPDYRVCDFAMSFGQTARPDHFRLPFWIWYTPEDLCLPTDARQQLERKTRFCNFLYSNPGGTRRLSFLRKLSDYRRVDCGGAILNNMGGRVTDKQAFLAGGKFTIAFENVSGPGYTTEKIADAMKASSIPIYWGNPDIGREFDPQSFINVHDFASDQAVIERIKELDQDDEAFISVLERPWFRDNKMPPELSDDSFLSFFERVLGAEPSPRPLYPLAQAQHELNRVGLRLQRSLARARGRLEVALTDRVLRRA